jgi:hypothetical protein
MTLNRIGFEGDEKEKGKRCFIQVLTSSNPLCELLSE